MALATIDQARRRCGIADGDFSRDVIINEILTASEEFARSRCHRIWEQQTITSEDQQGDDTDLLLLRRYPLVSITSIYIDDERKFDSSTLLTAWDPVAGTGDYMISDLETAAVLMMPSCAWGVWPGASNMIRATYVAGYGTGLAPTSIVEGILELTKTIYETENINSTLDSEKIGKVTYTYRSRNIGDSQNQRIKDVIDLWFKPYMMGVIG